MIAFETDRELAPINKFLSKEGIFSGISFLVSSKYVSSLEFAMKFIIRISFTASLVQILGFLFSIGDLGEILVSGLEYFVFVLLVLLNFYSILADFYTAFAFENKNEVCIKKCFWVNVSVFGLCFILYWLVCWVMWKRPETIKGNYPIKTDMELGIYTYVNLALVFFGLTIYHLIRLVAIFKCCRDLKRLLGNS